MCQNTLQDEYKQTLISLYEKLDKQSGQKFYQQKLIIKLFKISFPKHHSYTEINLP